MARPRKSRARLPRQGRGALQGIQQGVGYAVPTVFQSNGRRRQARKKNGKTKFSLDCMNAMMPAHLGLPRAVGAYTVVRTTHVLNASEALMVFGTYCLDGLNGTFSGLSPWSTVDAVGQTAANLGKAINTATAADRPYCWASAALSSGGFSGATMVPSAFSVQVMNPNALQTTNGIIYLGRMKTQPALRDSPLTWETFANNFVSYNAPRLCSAGKLALRGVQVDAIPYNFNVLSGFSQRNNDIAGPIQQFEWNGDLGTTAPFNVAGMLENKGFAPIVVYNPNGVSLQYLVTTEWRVRFDPTNPAQASHRHHPVTSDSLWDRVVGAMESAGHGVADIAEAVGIAGKAITAARGVMPALEAA